MLCAFGMGGVGFEEFVVEIVAGDDVVFIFALFVFVEG